MSGQGTDAREEAPSGALPQAVVLLIGLAAAAIAVAGLRGISFIVGPAFLALVLTIVVYPLQLLIVRKGMPRWSAFLIAMVTSYLIVIVIAGAVIFAMAQFVSILPQYADQARSDLATITDQLRHLGVTSDQQSSIENAINPSHLINLLVSTLSSLASAMSDVFFFVTVLFFVSIDMLWFPNALNALSSSHSRMVAALNGFAHNTRVYLVVSTVFGLVVAVLDTIVLAILGVPAAAAWGVLAFVTNYVPNIGFVIGLIPPAVLALLDGGPWKMAIVIICYCLINFVLQSLIQPKIVGDAVGLSGTITMISLLFWAWVLGPLGALLAVPLSLLVRAVLVDADDRATWLKSLLAYPTSPPRRRRGADKGKADGEETTPAQPAAG